jgi:NAD(P)-dependent dehydrogenase (short-subunit alcohol dehydrogenase family)
MKTALVTGGNRGIGFAVCRQLAEHGVKVFLGSRDFLAGENAAKELQKLGFDITPMQLDVSSQDSIEAAVEKLDGAVDILVNNAGVLSKETLLEGNLSSFDDSWKVHVMGPLQLVQKLMPGMNERQYGRVVNVSSGWGSFSADLGGPPPYSITKAALNAMTVKLSEEVQGDVKVNSMCPGWVRTEMGGSSAPRTPEEGADTIVWLATVDSDGPNGGFFRDREEIEW